MVGGRPLLLAAAASFAAVLLSSLGSSEAFVHGPCPTTTSTISSGSSGSSGSRPGRPASFAQQRRDLTRVKTWVDTKARLSQCIGYSSLT
jgi:hypothetical protein